MASAPSWQQDFRICTSWDGAPLPKDEHASVRAHYSLSGLEIAIDAPAHSDPPPPLAAGPVDGLWEYEVVELFLLAADGSYFEFELGPGGHWIALTLEDIRSVMACPLPTEVRVQAQGSRWSGKASFPANALPMPFVAGNACAIHGSGPNRRYASCVPLPGPVADFHQPQRFRRFDGSRS